MAALMKFQEQIDAINADSKVKEKEQLRLAAEAQAAADLKKGRRPPAAAAAVPPASPSKDYAAGSKKEANIVKENTKTDSDIKHDSEEPQFDLQAALIQPSTDDSTSILQDYLGDALLSSHGEMLVRLGAVPDLVKQFMSEGSLATDEEIGTVGVKFSGGADEMNKAVERLKEVVAGIGAEMSIVDSATSPSAYADVLLRLVPSSAEQIIEVRVACCGNVDSGKSSTLGVLTRGGLDDGRGKARVNLFRHKHEIETGRTSSIGMEILGFSPSGTPIIPSSHSSAAEEKDGFISSGATARREKLSWDEILKSAAKVVSFIDLAGHERYLKTTLQGMTGGAPDYVLLLVGGNAGLIGMSKEHLAVALALNVPVIVLITKIDMAPPHVLEATRKQLIKILKSPGCRKTPAFVKTTADVVALSSSFVSSRLCPVFEISNVTGVGLPHLRTFLNLLRSADKYEPDAPLEFSISDVFSVPFVGTVVSGLLNAGRVKAGDNVLIGPDSLGQFTNTAIKTIQRKRAPVMTAEAGQSVSFALKRIRRTAVRKGMVIVSQHDQPPKSVKTFEASILCLYHNTTIQEKYQAMLHSGSIRQTVRIVSILDKDNKVLRTGDRALVVFEFVGVPEFIKEGWKIIFREGKTKGLGVVTRVIN